MNRLLTCIAILIFLGGLLAPQSPAQELAPESYIPVLLKPFNKMVLDSSLNVITDSCHSLDTFYNQLAQLKMARLNDGTRVVSVLHLGDSHIQAGFLTGTVMRRFHHDFGNAGRGLITPLRMAKTNEPTDYIIRSDDKNWESAKVIQFRRTMPVGPGGVAIMNPAARFSLTVRALEKNETEDYSFNRIHILQEPGAPQLFVDDEKIDALSSHVANENPYATTIQLDHRVSEINLTGAAAAGHRDSSIYYGFILENGKNGVLYHSAGVNGAQYLHWSRLADWGQKCAALAPKLIILSMGTNESLRGARFVDQTFVNEIDLIVSRLKADNPCAVILLTTPPESFLRQRVGGQTVYKPNPLVKRISELIVQYAAEKGYACWDLFSISGGEGSSQMWLDNDLFGRDRLHFTAEGYDVIGNYLYRAILKGYNEYVANPDGEPAPDPAI